MLKFNYIKLKITFLFIKFLKLFYPKESIHRYEENLRSYLKLLNRPTSNSNQEIKDFFIMELLTNPGTKIVIMMF